MNKKALVLLSILLLAAMNLFARVDIDLALSSKTGMGINMSKPTDRAFSTRIEAELESIVDLYFDGKKSGVDILFGTDFKQKFTLGAGYTYKSAIDTASDFVVAAGPYFIFGSGCQVGLYFRADAKLGVAKNFFMKVGTGLDFEFLQLKQGGATADLDISIPLPRVAFGWTL